MRVGGWGAVGMSKLLDLRPTDMLLYSAKMIPGNEKRVIRLMNQIANCGTSIKLGSVEGLHTSGHAYSGELQEVSSLFTLTLPSALSPLGAPFAHPLTTSLGRGSTAGDEPDGAAALPARPRRGGVPQSA